MAPLSQTSNQDSSGSTIISGEAADCTTAPTNSLQVAGKDGSGNLQTILTDTNGQVEVGDLANVSMTYTNKSVSTTAVLMNVSGTNLAVRKLLVLQPTNGTIYIGSNSSVTTTTGMPVYSTQTITFAVGPNVSIYAIAAGATNVCIIEAS